MTVDTAEKMYGDSPYTVAEVKRAQNLLRECFLLVGDPGHVVYRHFTQDNILLYVGYSVDCEKRQYQHRKKAPWWEFSERIEITEYDNRDEALRAEMLAIRTERPLWNIQGNAR